MTAMFAAVLPAGGYLSLGKIIVMLVLIAPWLAAAPWIHKDTVRVRRTGIDSRLPLRVHQLHPGASDGQIRALSRHSPLDYHGRARFPGLMGHQPNLRRGRAVRRDLDDRRLHLA